MSVFYTEIFGEDYAEVLSVRKNGTDILVRNYRISLTAFEHAIVSLLADKCEWVSKEQIAALLCNGKPIRSSSIPTHVSNINKKVSMMIGRKLIEGNRSGEYRVSHNA